MANNSSILSSYAKARWLAGGVIFGALFFAFCEDRLDLFNKSQAATRESVATYTKLEEQVRALQSQLEIDSTLREKVK